MKHQLFAIRGGRSSSSRSNDDDDNNNCGGGCCLLTLLHIYVFLLTKDGTWDLTPINSFQGEHLENGFHFYDDYCGIRSISFSIARMVLISFCTI